MSPSRMPLASTRFSFFLLAALLSSAATSGCSSDDSDGDGSTGGAASGGGPGTGGAASGGGPGTGGATSGGAASGGNAGTGGDASTGGDAGTGGSGSGDYPADTSQASIEAYLEAESYKEDPWIGEATSRTPGDVSNPHKEMVRVFYNPAAAGSAPLEEGVLGTDAPLNAMAVKEIYDESDTMIGRAVRWRIGEAGGLADWVSYCTSPADSTACTGTVEDAVPVYRDGGFNTCASCHGNSGFFAPRP